MDDIRKQAKKRVEAKKGFYIHFGVYIVVGLFFLIMNLLTYSESEGLWFYFPMLAWGIGLAIHYFVVFGLPGTNILSKEWEANEMEKEMDKILYQRNRLMEPSSDELDLEEEDFMELKKREKIVGKRWDQNDIV